MKQLDSHTKALIAILLVVLFGSGNAPLGKIALREIPPFSYTFIRFLITFVCLLPFLIKEKPTFNKHSIKIFFISFLAAGNVILFAFGVARTAASVAQMIHAVIPLLVAFFSMIVLRETVAKNKFLGILIGFLGVSLIIMAPVLTQVQQVKGASLLGNLLVFISAIVFSLYSVLSKKLQEKYTPVYLTIFFALATLLSSGFFLPYEASLHPHWWTKVSFAASSSMLITGFFGSFLLYTLYQYAIKHGTPIIASVALYLVPIAAYIWSLILLDEKLTLTFAIGSLITFVGAYIVTKKSKAATLTAE